MGDFSFFGDGQSWDNDPRASSTFPIKVPAGSTINTLGSWVELTAATAIEAAGFFLFIKPNDRPGSGTDINASSLIDIGIGAAASEIVLVDKILHSITLRGYTNHPDNAIMTMIQFPIGIPLGTRISARAQSHGGMGGGDIPLGVSLYGLSFEGGEPCGGCTTYGADTSISNGTAVTSSTANTYGSWVEIGTGLTRDCCAVILLLHWEWNLSAVSTLDCWIDIAIGGFGSELPVIEKLSAQIGEDVNAQITPQAFGPLPLQAKAGDHISVRIQSSSSSSVTIYASIIALEE